MRPFHLLIQMLVLIACASLIGCTARQSPVSVASLRAEEDPDQESWNPELFLSEEGLPRVHMRARYLARYDRPDSTYMVFSGTDDGERRVRVDLFDTLGDSSAVVTSDRLTYYNREKRFVARGNVIVETPDGSLLESEHLAWSEQEGRITTPGLVRYTTGNRVVTGYNLEANENLTEVSITDGAAVQLVDDP